MSRALALLDEWGYRKAAQPPAPAMLMAQADGQRWQMPDAMVAERQARLYTALTWIATAVDNVAMLGAGGVLSVKQLVGGPDGDEKDIPNHPFELLLRKPNPKDSGYEFVRDLLSWFKVTGNSYTYLNLPDGEGSQPDELWVVPSSMMTPIPDGQSYIRGYNFTVPGKEAVFVDRWRIVHNKTFNPFNPFVGLSAVQSLATDAYGDLAQQKWNLALFDKSNGKFPGILAFKQMIADDQWKKLIAQRDSEWGGTNRAGVTMLRGVGDSIQWLPAAMSQKEMEFLDGRTFTKELIYGKLAPGLASILAVNATEANAIAGKAILIEFGVWPLLEQMAQKFTSDLMPLYGDGLVAEFDDMRQTNRLLDLQEQQEYAKTHTVDEIRNEYYGDAPLTIGDSKETDPRGALLLAQIGPSTPNPATPKPEPVPMIPAVPPVMQQPGDALPDSELVADELVKWEKFALRQLGKQGGRLFEPRVLPLFQAARIKAALGKASDAAGVRDVFAQERAGDDDKITELTAAIREATARL